MAIRSHSAGNVFDDNVRRVLTIIFTPMPDTVARLNASDRGWVLYLDPDSSAEDQCWAMCDVLAILADGPGVAGSAVRMPHLRLIQG